MRKTRVLLVALHCVLLYMLIAVSCSAGVMTGVDLPSESLRSGELAWADYDRDGDLDLAATGKKGNGSPFTGVYKNNGDGTFTLMTDGFVQVFNSCLAWGDADNDGDLDLIVAGSREEYPNENPNTSIYLNDNGTFVNTGRYILNVFNGDVAWGDFDNDGWQDIAIAGNGWRDLKCYILRNGREGYFNPISSQLVPVERAELAWSDYDLDGDLDLVVAGIDNYSNGVTRLYRNDNGTFVDSQAPLVNTDTSSLAWGDYDNDGDPDLVVSGVYGGYNHTDIYRNDHATLTKLSQPWTGYSSMGWGDFDNDGDLDLAATGSQTGRIYRNDAGNFVDSGEQLVSPIQSSLSWGDYDNDGDLDLVVCGEYLSSIKLFRNDVAKANTPPGPPTKLYMMKTQSDTIFCWNSGTDSDTPSSGLTYNLRIGTAPGLDDVYRGVADLKTGKRFMPGIGYAARNCSWTVKGLDLSNNTYYWSVQAIDTALAGSAWSQEVSTGGPHISGHVRSGSGQGVAGVSVYLDDSNAQGVLTDGSGFFEIYARTGWTGTISARKSGCVFSPQGRAVTEPLTENLTDQDFMMTQGFTAISTPITPVWNCATTWADYDGDGDLDLAVQGDTTVDLDDYYDYMNPIGVVYANNNGNLSPVVNLPAVLQPSAAWGDYDNDNDPDYAFGGFMNMYSLSYGLFRNDGGTLSYLSSGLGQIYASTSAWGDYDNDGDMDFGTGTSGEYGYGTIFKNDNDIFSQTEVPFSSGQTGAFAWGDYDNDGDLDVVITGGYYSANTMLFRNDNGVFTRSDNNQFMKARWSSLDWADYDCDGDLDLAISGLTSSNPVAFTSRIYRNDGGGVFTDINAGLVNVGSSSLAWGDYDNDGDPDLVITGMTYWQDYLFQTDARIYRNDNGVFTDSGVPIVKVAYGKVSWADVDNDADLDLMVTGVNAQKTLTSVLYRNETAVRNTPPVPPAYIWTQKSGDNTTFNWIAGYDTETSMYGLSYNLRVGTTPGGCDIFSGMADPSTGRRLVSGLGNAQKSFSWSLKGLVPGAYYWSVQSIDSGFAGSAWAEEQQYVVDTEPPVIHSITLSPSLAASGDMLDIQVDVTDNVHVSTVTSGYMYLYSMMQDNIWQGPIFAFGEPGTYTVQVTATDTSGNETTGTASYKIVPILGISNRSVSDTIMTSAVDNFLFKLWGRVTVIDQDYFSLDDGSGMPVTVHAPWHSLGDNAFASARGVLSPGTTPPSLESRSYYVQRLDATGE